MGSILSFMRYFILFFIFIAITACNKKEFCITPDIMTIGMNFKTYDSTNTLVDTFLVNASVHNTDTAVYFADNVENLGSVLVAPRRTVSQQTYIIDQSLRSDTITIFYKGEENFISNGCGYQTFFELTSVKHSTNSIDDVIITNAIVNPSSLSNHLEVIYK